MEKFLYLFVHLGIPLVILCSLWAIRAKSKIGIVLGAAFQITCLLFLFQWGQFPLVGSYYIRYIVLAILFVAILVAWLKWSMALPLLPKGWIKWVLLSTLLVFTALLVWMNVQAYQGMYNKLEPVGDLRFPLKDGRYYVSSGGTTAIMNNHFRKYPNSQQFAIDINQINRLGSASGKVFTHRSEEHLIYGKNVYCPCSGVVKATRNDVPDNLRTDATVNHEFGRGNYVELDCAGMLVSMYHLAKGSIAVKPGDRVVSLQRIARVGNSGFSMEPHLHIQAARYREDSTLVGVPVTFDQQWLVRNNLVRNN